MSDPRLTDLRQRVSYWSQRTKLTPKALRFRKMTRKWGSCSTNGYVTLAYDLLDKGRDFQDYVIVHELLHLRYSTHGKVFKSLMSAYVPGWREHDKERINGSNV